MTAKCGHNAAVRYWRTWTGRNAYMLFCQGCGEVLATGKWPWRVRLKVRSQIAALCVITLALTIVVAVIIAVTP